MTSLDHALTLWHRGLSVIPVPRAGGRLDGKTPVVPWTEYQTRRPAEAEIRAWFTGEMNIGIITGAVSGIVAIDCDSPEALRLWTRHRPYTAWQTRTARGYHLFYRHPGIHVPNKSKIHMPGGRVAIDVRGDGGYVIAPGSVHETGVEYRAAGDWTVSRDQLPRLWVGWLARPRQAPSPARPRPTGDVVARARAYLSAIPRPEIGQGSDEATLYAACRLVRGFEVPEADAVSLLWEWAGGRPGWTHAWVAAKVQHAARYGTEPVGALR